MSMLLIRCPTEGEDASAVSLVESDGIVCKESAGTSDDAFVAVSDTHVWGEIVARNADPDEGWFCISGGSAMHSSVAFGT